MLECTLYGLIGSFCAVLVGGLAFVGLRARGEQQTARWTGYVFVAAFCVLWAFGMFMGAVAD